MEGIVTIICSVIDNDTGEEKLIAVKMTGEMAIEPVPHYEAGERIPSRTDAKLEGSTVGLLSSLTVSFPDRVTSWSFIGDGTEQVINGRRLGEDATA